MSLVNNDSVYLWFPSMPVLLDSNLITVSVEHIKSRVPSIVYPVLNVLDKQGSLMYSLNGERWAIGTEYGFESSTFELTEETLPQVHSLQLKLVLLNISSENPLRFTGVMMQNKAYTEYHRPEDVIKEVSVEFVNNNYVNLYNTNNDNYLQIIRPNKDNFTNKLLTRSQCTVLAPHLSNEDSFDNPINLVYEFLNQREQVIDIER